MNQIVTTLRVFAFVLFLFLPSIGVLLATAFWPGGSGYFIPLGFATLLANGIALFVPPIKGAVGAHFMQIARGR